jgi:lysyl-tRNA synthetase class 2
MDPRATLVTTRHEFLRAVRAFFEESGFLETVTPTLVTNPGLEPHLLPFETTFVPQMRAGTTRAYYLPTSPEYHLKKVLSWGIPRVFEIAKSFRNGEESARHEPEFLMLEWYRHPGSYQEIATDFSRLLTQLGKRWAPSAPWNQTQHLSVCDAFRDYAGLDLEGALLGTRPSLVEQARKAGLHSVLASDSFEDAFHKILLEKIEARLGWEGPLFLWDYPASLCALARLKPGAPHLCERFEVYWKGIELANAFGELTDAAEQRRRCESDRKERLRLYGSSPALDEEFLKALEDLGELAGGIAVGLDRLLQCLLGASDLQSVLLFPKTKDCVE